MQEKYSTVPFISELIFTRYWCNKRIETIFRGHLVDFITKCPDYKLTLMAFLAIIVKETWKY